MNFDRSTSIDKTSVFQITFLGSVAGILFLLGPANVGFLSDDYDLLHRASETSWFQAMGRHHWSPVMMLLFKATHAGIVGRWAWVVIAYVAHCANILIVWRILVHRLKIPTLEVFTISLLFTLCSVGFEALIWSCALGYVLVTTIILLGLLSVQPGETNYSTLLPLKLAFLQVVALLIWDWGFLFTPMMALYLVFYSPGKIRDILAVLKRNLLQLWLSFGCWLLFLLAKATMGQSLGYSVTLNAVRSVYFLITSPLRGIYPNGLTTFYKAPPGLFISLLILLFFITYSIKNRNIRLAFVLFIFCQLPYVFLGAPESRYFYLAAPFLYTSLVLSISKIFSQKTTIFALVVLTVLNSLWVVERILLWEGASREAQKIKVALDAEINSTIEPVVVMNLPDSYGPTDMMWKPYLWRNGLKAFATEIIRVNTPNNDFTLDNAIIPVMNIVEIQKKYANYKLVGVRYTGPANWEYFEVYSLSKKYGPN